MRLPFMFQYHRIKVKYANKIVTVSYSDFSQFFIDRNEFVRFLKTIVLSV